MNFQEKVKSAGTNDNRSEYQSQIKKLTQVCQKLKKENDSLKMKPSERIIDQTAIDILRSDYVIKFIIVF